MIKVSNVNQINENKLCISHNQLKSMLFSFYTTFHIRASHFGSATATVTVTFIVTVTVIVSVIITVAKLSSTISGGYIDYRKPQGKPPKLCLVVLNFTMRNQKYHLKNKLYGSKTRVLMRCRCNYL